MNAIARMAAVVGLVATCGCWDFDAALIAYCDAGRCESGVADDGGGPGADAGDVVDGGADLDGGAELDGGSDAGFVCPEVPDFVGDFETQATIAPWTGLDLYLSDQFSIVDSAVVPPRAGSRAAQFTVRSGDETQSGEERSMVEWSSGGEGEGDEFYYGWSTWIPSTSWTGSHGRTIARWDSEESGSGPLRIRLTDQSIEAWVELPDSTEVVIPISALLAKDAWHDFVVRVRWSVESAQGQVQLWHRIAGEPEYQPVETVDTQTLVKTSSGTASPMKFQLGVTRGPVSTTDVIFHDGFRRGTSFCSAAP